MRLEKSLGLFTSGVFDDGDDAIYPEPWKDAGSDQGEGKFFRTTYLLLYIGAFFLIASVLLSSASSSRYFSKYGDKIYIHWPSCTRLYKNNM